MTDAEFRAQVTELVEQWRAENEAAEAMAMSDAA